jgi:Tfp pilus assembly protein PilF
MGRCLILVLAASLSACAVMPPSDKSAPLFYDQWFAAPSERINADDVFAMNDAMRHYLSVDMAEQIRVKGRQKGLIDALYKSGQLKLEYDPEMTRNASEAFASRSGNCLSLVIMTAAFAKELGLSVQYQDVIVDETWARSGDIYYAIGHVNLTLAKKEIDVTARRQENTETTIDFLPPGDIRWLRMRVIAEQTIVAMYMNNRAVESLARSDLNDAYWWAREAIAQDPRFLSSYNTLGAIYQRHGNLEQAEHIFAWVLAREPGNTRTMANEVTALNQLGRTSDANALAKILHQLEPFPPFSYFNRGIEAMKIGDFKTARDLFAKEVDRAAYYHEFHFWLAIASARLGDLEQARKHLAIAIENSTTRTDHDLYAAKLDRLKASRYQ